MYQEDRDVDQGDTYDQDEEIHLSPNAPNHPPTEAVVFFVALVAILVGLIQAYWRSRH